jgi:hypothetical protein
VLSSNQSAVRAPVLLGSDIAATRPIVGTSSGYAQRKQAAGSSYVRLLQARVDG